MILKSQKRLWASELDRKVQSRPGGILGQIYHRARCAFVDLGSVSDDHLMKQSNLLPKTCQFVAAALTMTSSSGPMSSRLFSPRGDRLSFARQAVENGGAVHQLPI